MHHRRSPKCKKVQMAKFSNNFWVSIQCMSTRKLYVGVGNHVRIYVIRIL